MHCAFLCLSMWKVTSMHVPCAHEHRILPVPVPAVTACVYTCFVSRLCIRTLFPVWLHAVVLRSADECGNKGRYLARPLPWWWMANMNLSALVDTWALEISVVFFLFFSYCWICTTFVLCWSLTTCLQLTNYVHYRHWTCKSDCFRWSSDYAREAGA